MKMNASTDYAIRMLIYLAEKNGIASSSELSRYLVISQRYLLQVGAKLRDADMIKVTFGSEGGYQLISNPEDISIYDIIILMEGTTFLVPSSAQAEDEIRNSHTINEVYQLLQSIWDGFLMGVTLDTMTNKSPEDIKALMTDQLTHRLSTIVKDVAEKMSLDI